ncbi:Uncharacterized membrane-anchored protein [Catalinimonas alkaloidigena]|uniref:Uncharacterized membrane-anchored protein n=2 Tax=Catalinimonas alkaloidigena TaxID=1075417 RepID=A0A1G9KXI5_9BACT|nr:Uncharacterized membrane-anchored protein [Catalinimonas alkaloidigena]
MFVSGLFATVLCTGGFSAYGFAEPDVPEVDSTALQIAQINESFRYETGEVTIGDDLARIQVPEGYRFLDAEQSKYVLSDLWGNPPDESTLGMLVPDGYGPASDDMPFAVEISYSEEGYISDEDAEDLDYEDLLEEMQEDARTANQQRQEAGYPTVELVGWAAPPFYDLANKKLHWAKELRFEGMDQNTLNYNIRVLGRRGYLVLNAIGNIHALPAVQQDADKILASVDFTEGNRYADFNPELDKVAAYGIGGLITGKILAKAGFFALLLKFWKVLAAGVAGVFYFLKRRLFGGTQA